VNSFFFIFYLRFTQFLRSVVDWFKITCVAVRMGTSSSIEFFFFFSKIEIKFARYLKERIREKISNALGRIRTHVFGILVRCVNHMPYSSQLSYSLCQNSRNNLSPNVFHKIFCVTAPAPSVAMGEYVCLLYELSAFWLLFFSILI